MPAREESLEVQRCAGGGLLAHWRRGDAEGWIAAPDEAALLEVLHGRGVFAPEEVPCSE